jgi:hypothetical protein
MDPDLSQLVVMRMDAEPPSQHTAGGAGGQGELLVLRLDDRVAWTRGENVLLIAGQPGRRLFMQAAYVAPSGRFHMVRKASGWRPFDARRQERYPTRFQARLRLNHGAWRSVGTIVDMSSGGLAVDVPSDPPEAHLSIDISAAGYRAELPIEVLSLSDGGGIVTLHCRYEALSQAQTAFVRAVIADLEEKSIASAA